nr:hypothetical protein [Arthrobacter sp. H14]
MVALDEIMLSVDIDAVALEQPGMGRAELLEDGFVGQAGRAAGLPEVEKHESWARG